MLGVGILSGTMAGVLVTPDVDLPTKTYEENRVYRVNRWIGIAWQTFWTPYALIFRHREISHWHLIGTATRMIYMLGAAYIMIGYVAVGIYNDICVIGGMCIPIMPMAIGPLPELVKWLWPYWLGWFIGESVQDSIHIITDWGYSRRKRRRGKRNTLRTMAAIAILLAAMWYIFINK